MPDITMKPLLRSALALALVLAAAAALGQNLVANPGFETGDFAGHAVANPDPNTLVVSVDGQNGTGAVAAENIDAGTYSAFFGTQGATTTLSQTLATTVGQRYTVSFDLRAGTSDSASNAPGSFVARFGGRTLLSLIDPPLSGGFATYSFDVVGSGSDEIAFEARNDPAAFLLDQISVVAVQSAPEPSALAALGLGSLALLKRRRR